MYVRKIVQPQPNPPIYGWNNALPDFVAQEQIVHAPVRTKYEAGTYNLLGLVGMIVGMELLLEVGLENISLRHHGPPTLELIPALQSKVAPC